MSFFVTSDQHFNHANMVTKFCRGEFGSTKEMNEALIKHWNDVVTDDDTVIVAGDFFMGSVKSIPAILNRLNGDSIILIPGNHDYQKRLDVLEKCGVEIADPRDFIGFEHNGVWFHISHEPVPEEERRQKMNDGMDIIYLYGHLHDSAPSGFDGNSYHVGVDTNNYTPINLDTIATNWKLSQGKVVLV